MFKELQFIKSRLLRHLLGWSALLFLIVKITSCSMSSGKSVKIETNFSKPKPVVDTMAIIAKQINASHKASQLDSIYRIKSRLRGFNGNVLVAQRGVIVYRKCFGFRNYEHKDSLNPDTKFQIASLSKTFTAVAILKLMEEGKLKLTDFVSDYFPELPFSKITIAMLLSHRSGLANYVNVYNDKVIKGNLYPTQSEMFGWFKTFGKQYMAPAGKFFNYSNTNFVLLAGIIEKVSGLSYSEYLHKFILEPLKMNDTYVALDSVQTAFENRTVSYDGLWRKKSNDYFDAVVGDKGIYSTVNDLYKWYDGLINYKILSKETIDMAWMPRSKEKGGVRNYGYGFRMLCYNDTDKIVYHNGWWNSYNSLFYINPKQKYVIIVLGNKYNNDIYDVHAAYDVMNEVNNGREEQFD